MKTIRCLISNIPQKMLSDVIFGNIQEHEDIEVVDQVNDREGLKAAISQQSIDVLILGLKQDCFPDYCKEFLNEFSNLLIVGLSDDGRLASVYINDIGPQDIIKLIRTFGATGSGL